MIQNITKSMFHDAFIKMNRGKQFSPGALSALFAYFEDSDEAFSKESALDVIAICDEFTEYANIKEFHSDYGFEYESLADIEQTTTLIRIENSDSFIIRQF